MRNDRSAADDVIVRDDWVGNVCGSLQRAIGQGLLAGIERKAVIASIQIPLPITRIEELVLRGLLSEAASGGRCMNAADVSARARELAATSAPSRVPSIARRAALHIADHHSVPLDVRALAAAVGCDQTRLRRCFRDEYGMTVREYYLRSRAQDAVRRIANENTKIRTVAAAVGYASEKNFYRVLRRFTGETPAALRQLSPARLRELADTLVPACRAHRAPATVFPPDGGVFRLVVASHRAL